ncbi:hypothetical protein Bbelb_007850 [Branchiostoma belcheri]|nr:hypothetical protein Bbelb_007850 [Branchiostoma belcheri]
MKTSPFISTYYYQGGVWGGIRSACCVQAAFNLPPAHCFRDLSPPHSPEGGCFHKPVRYTASTLPNYAHWRTQHARHVFFQARRMNIPVNTSNHQYCSSKRAEENLKGNGENVRNDDTYTTRHKRCRSPALNEQVSTRNVRKTGTTASITSRTTTCPMSHHTCHLACYCSASQCSQTTTLRTSCTRDPSNRDSDKHHIYDLKVTPLAMCVTARLPLPECTKKYSSRDSDEHNMHDEISHRSPCVTARLPLPECTKEHSSRDNHTARHVCYRSTALPECTKEHSLRDSDEHNMHDGKITPLVMCVTARLPLPECTKEHSSRDSDEHNMHDEKITPPAMCVYRSLLPSKCTKEHLRENSDEHSMTTKRSHRPPCVSTAHCSRRSVPKNTSERTVTNTT